MHRSPRRLWPAWAAGQWRTARTPRCASTAACKVAGAARPPPGLLPCRTPCVPLVLRLTSSCRLQALPGPMSAASQAPQGLLVRCSAHRSAFSAPGKHAGSSTDSTPFPNECSSQPPCLPGAEQTWVQTQVPQEGLARPDHRAHPAPQVRLAMTPATRWSALFKQTHRLPEALALQRWALCTTLLTSDNRLPSPMQAPLGAYGSTGAAGPAGELCMLCAPGSLAVTLGPVYHLADL